MEADLKTEKEGCGMVDLIVVYECPVKEIEGYKVPDVPEHSYKWRVNDLKTEYTEAGEIKEYFVVKSEMTDSEFEKIRDNVKIKKVFKLE